MMACKLFLICEEGYLLSSFLVTSQIFWHITNCEPFCVYCIVNSWKDITGRFYFIIPCFGEKRVERIISYSNCVIWWHLTIWMDPMFQAIELPGCVAHLTPSLAHMNGDHFSLESNRKMFFRRGNFFLFTLF